jgi:TonB family protein
MSHAAADLRRNRLVRCALLALLLLSVTCRAVEAANAPVPAPDAAGGAVLARAQELLSQDRYQDAADAFSAANQAAGGHCGACLLGEADAVSRLGRNESALDLTRQAIAALQGDLLLGRAYCQLGDRLLSGSADAAEEAYGKALAPGASYRAEALAGMAVAQRLQGRYTEAAATAVQAIAAQPSGGNAGLARSTICKARREGGLTPEAAPMPPLRPSVPSIVFLQPPANDEPDALEPLRIGGAVAKPEKIYAPPPVYCEQARKLRTEGVVILESIIDRDGCLTNAAVLKHLTPCLDLESLSAVEGWVFAPATLGGKPVRVYYSLTIAFRIEDPPPPTAPTSPPRP